MRGILFAVLVVASIAFHAGDVFARAGGAAHGSSSSSESVRGYLRKNGRYVAPHRRSLPDGNKRNNWSTKGNVNPYTGKPGTKPIK